MEPKSLGVMENPFDEPLRRVLAGQELLPVYDAGHQSSSPTGAGAGPSPTGAGAAEDPSGSPSGAAAETGTRDPLELVQGETVDETAKGALAKGSPLTGACACV